MSKELEALYRLATRNSGNHRSIEEVDKDFKIIEKALKDYESIDNSNPSEALECVEALKEDGCITTLYQGKALETIRQALLQAEQYKKVLNSLIGKVIWVDNGILECGNTEQDCVLGFDVFPDEEEYTFICNFIEKMTEKKDRSE